MRLHLLCLSLLSFTVACSGPSDDLKKISNGLKDVSISDPVTSSGDLSKLYLGLSTPTSIIEAAALGEPFLIEMAYEKDGKSKYRYGAYSFSFDKELEETEEDSDEAKSQTISESGNINTFNECAVTTRDSKVSFSMSPTTETGYFRVSMDMESKQLERNTTYTLPEGKVGFTGGEELGNYSSYDIESANCTMEISDVEVTPIYQASSFNAEPATHSLVSVSCDELASSRSGSIKNFKAQVFCKVVDQTVTQSY